MNYYYEIHALLLRYLVIIIFLLEYLKCNVAIDKDLDPYYHRKFRQYTSSKRKLTNSKEECSLNDISRSVCK